MASVPRLSAEDIIQLARARFDQFTSLSCVGYSMPNHVFSSLLSGLSREETKDVELVSLLLASAEKVAEKEFDEGSRLLRLCDFLSSRTGSSAQRTVYYFTKALQERIDTERRTALEGSKGSEEHLHDHEEMAYKDPSLIACFLRLPFFQITQFTGMQAIEESVASAKKVHYIDLGIRNGVQCIGLMQALATRKEFPIELLKITAVGTTSRHYIEETGKRLAHFAETLNLPFSFQTVMVSEVKHLNKDMIGPKDDEFVAVNCWFLQHTMIKDPSCLESLITTLRDLNPRVMVSIEADSDNTSPTLIGRFHEALSFFSALFECLGVCMDQNDLNRMRTEAELLNPEIRNSVGAEVEGRIFWRMNLDAWRKFLTGFGMVEQEISMSSFYQAELLVKDFASGSCCTLGRNGKCLTIGWKRRPMFYVSSWTFKKENDQKKDSQHAG